MLININANHKLFLQCSRRQIARAAAEQRRAESSNAGERGVGTKYSQEVCVGSDGNANTIISLNLIRMR